MNGDGIPDIVAPPARLGGDSSLHIWLGDGHGKFTRAKLTLHRERESPSRGSRRLRRRRRRRHRRRRQARRRHGLARRRPGRALRLGRVRPSTSFARGCPEREFSTQAVALTDVNGDGKLDIVGVVGHLREHRAAKWNPHQLRVYLYDGARGWKYAPDALVDGAYSNSIAAWDYNGDGRLDILTGSQAYSAVQILWKNDGNGTFSTGYFPQIEIHGYHFATSPGTFGKERAPGLRRRVHAGRPTSPCAWTPRASRSTRTRTTPGPAIASGARRAARALSGRPRWETSTATDSTTWSSPIRPAGTDSGSFCSRPTGPSTSSTEKLEPVLDSPGQCVRLADLDRDGRLDVVVVQDLPRWTLTGARGMECVPQPQVTCSRQKRLPGTHDLPA